MEHRQAPDQDEKETIPLAEETIPLAEWAVAAVGTVLVLGTIIFLAYRGFSEQTSPSFTSEIQAIENLDGIHAVTILVHNQGGRPVASLVARGSRDRQDQRELTIDYLPAHSARAVTFLFSKHIRAEQFECEFTSYNEP